MELDINLALLTVDLLAVLFLVWKGSAWKQEIDIRLAALSEAVAELRIALNDHERECHKRALDTATRLTALETKGDG